MKKILTVLGIFMVLGFVFTGVNVASAADSCIVGPLNVSMAQEVISRNGEAISVEWTKTDRVSVVPSYSRNGEKVETVRAATTRLSSPPEALRLGKEETYVVFRGIC